MEEEEEEEEEVVEKGEREREREKTTADCSQSSKVREQERELLEGALIPSAVVSPSGRCWLSRPSARLFPPYREFHFDSIEKKKCVGPCALETTDAME